MTLRRITIFIMIFIASILTPNQSSAEESDERIASDYITIPLQVINADNSPAHDTTVTIHSMSRVARQGMEQLNNRLFPPVVTDSQGSATLHYPTRLNSSSGYGLDPLFAVVDPSLKQAGAIIQLSAFSSELSDLEVNNPISVKLNDGYTLRGIILNPNGDPLTATTVTINHDLHAETHTGYGGAIWERQGITDENGQFTFTHVNPSPVSINLVYSSKYYWKDTTINGQKTYDCTDVFQPEWNNAKNDILIHLAASPAKVYQGIAVNKDGKPVANAEVSIGYSHRRNGNTWSDGRSHETTSTLTDGSWRLEIPTEWVTYGTITQRSKSHTDEYSTLTIARGHIDLSITASQVVRLLPEHPDN